MKGGLVASHSHSFRITFFPDENCKRSVNLRLSCLPADFAPQPDYMLWHTTSLHGESTNGALDACHAGISKLKYFFLLVGHTFVSSA